VAVQPVKAAANTTSAMDAANFAVFMVPLIDPMITL
jgi:hypothetical protein